MAIIYHPANVSYPIISTPFILDHMKHGGNTPGLITAIEHVCVFDFKWIQSQFSNAPPAPNFSESVLTVDPQHIYG